MNLSFKDLRFIIEAIEHQINAYQERLQVIEDLDEDEDEAAARQRYQVFRASMQRHNKNFRAEQFSQAFKFS